MRCSACCDGTAIAGDLLRVAQWPAGHSIPFFVPHHHHLPSHSPPSPHHTHLKSLTQRRRTNARMPYVEIPAAAAPDRAFAHHPLFELVARDARSTLTPNDTQRTTLIVAGCYIIAIAILWCARLLVRGWSFGFFD